MSSTLKSASSTSITCIDVLSLITFSRVYSSVHLKYRSTNPIKPMIGSFLWWFSLYQLQYCSVAHRFSLGRDWSFNKYPNRTSMYDLLCILVSAQGEKSTTFVTSTVRLTRKVKDEWLFPFWEKLMNVLFFIFEIIFILFFFFYFDLTL